MAGVFFIIAACALWALDTLVRYPLIRGGAGASSVVLAEHALLVLIFSPVLWRMRRRWRRAGARDLLAFLFIGGAGSALATIAFTRAFGLINPSLVIMLQKFQPVVAVALARAILREPVKREFLLWASLCLAGGALVSYRDLAGLSLEGGERALQGHLLALLAVLGWGGSTVLGKRLIRRDYRESEVMAGRFLFGLLALLPLAAAGQAAPPSGVGELGKILLLVLCSGVLGMGLYYRGLRLLNARLCALLEMFFPFCAVVVNWIFLGASLTLTQLLGGVMLLAGATVIRLRHY